MRADSVSAAFFLILWPLAVRFLFFFNDPATTEIYTLSLHDALLISASRLPPLVATPATRPQPPPDRTARTRSEEHTSEFQSHSDLVCRLLLEKKKKTR